MTIVLLIGNTYAATGWYSDYVIINSNYGGNSYYWIGSDPSFGSELNGNDFGTVGSLVITGVDMKYWGDGADRTGGAFYYEVTSEDGYTTYIGPTEVIWTQSSIGGNDFQGIWSGTIDIISSLTANTTYKLVIWAKSWGTSQGDSWLTNGGSNYVATFTTSKTINWTGGTNNDWSTAGNWSDGVPSSVDNVVVPSSLSNYPTITSAVECNNLTIQSDASLIGAENLTVNGTGIIKRSISQYSTDNDGWHLISSPVSSFTIAGSDFAPVSGTDDLYEFDESVNTNNWLNYTGGTFGDTEFEVGKGYLAAYETTETKEFSGAINTGSIQKNLSWTENATYEGMNLLGNPYTSAVDWDLLTKTASVDGSVYILQSSNNQYISWNGSTGDLTDGIIPSMQGFFVYATATGQSVTFESADQVHDNSNYYKNTSDLADNTIKVNVTGQEGSSNTYIQLREDATVNFDNAIDAYKLFGYTSAPEIYTSDLDNIYSINCLPLNNSYNVPLCVKSEIGGEFTLSFSDNSNIPTEYIITLEDNKTNQSLVVSNDFNYSYTSESNDDPNRFTIHFGVVGIEDQLSTKAIQAYVSGNQLTILGNSGDTQVDIINLHGQVVQSNMIYLDGKYNQKLNLKAGVYIVRTNNISNKVIIN